MKFKRFVCLLLAVVTAMSSLIFVSVAADDRSEIKFASSADVSAVTGRTNASTKYFASESAIRITATSPAPAITLQASVTGSYRYAVVTYRHDTSNSTSAYDGTLELLQGGNVTASKQIEYTRGKRYYSTILKLGTFSGADSVRLRAFNNCTAGDFLYLYGIAFFKTEGDAADYAASAEIDACGAVVSRYGESTLLSKKYVWSDYMYSYWDSDLVINEAVYPLKQQNGTMADITLMYSADRIVSVRSSSLATEYKEGVDYELVNGKLRILTSGSIKCVNYSDHYYTYNKSGSYPMRQVSSSRWVRFQEGSPILNDQIAVTYTHSDDWAGASPARQGESLPKTRSKLESGGSLKIVYFGDSITNGGNSSGCESINIAPYAEVWTKMFEHKLGSMYPDASITTVNGSVSGGSWTPEAVDNVQGSIINNNPDLVILALGTNDYQFEYSASQTYNSMSYVVDKIEEKLPNCEIILVAPMLSNPECFNKNLLDQYISGYRSKAAEYDDIVIADVNSIHKYLLTRKSYTDMSANNLCHCNDFFARIYAQVMAETISASGVSEAYRTQFSHRLSSLADTGNYYEAEAQAIRDIISDAASSASAASTFTELEHIYKNASLRISLIDTKDAVDAGRVNYKNIIFDNTYAASLFKSVSYMTKSFNKTEGALQFKMNGENKDCRSTVTYPEAKPVYADTNKYVILTYKVPENTSAAADTTQLFFYVGSNQSTSETTSVKFSPQKDGAYHSKIIDLSNSSWWTGRLLKIRLDPFATSSAGDTMFVYSLSLCSDLADAELTAGENEDNANKVTGRDAAVYYDSESAISSIGSATVYAMCGDADRDGSVTALDLVFLKDILGGNEAALSGDYSLVDIDSDKSITAKDVIALKDILGGATNYPGKTYTDPICCRTLAGGASYASLTKGEGRFAVLSANADFAPRYAVVRFRTEATSVTFYLGNTNKGSRFDIKPASSEAGFAVLEIPSGVSVNSVTLEVPDCGVDLFSFALFETERGKDQFIGTAAQEIEEEHAGQNENVEILFDGNLIQKISYSNHATVEASGGSLKFTVSTDRVDPYVYFDLSSYGISADEYKYLVYSYKVPQNVSDRAQKAQIFFCSGKAQNPAEASSMIFTLDKTGSAVNKTLDLSSASYWGGNVLGLRLDFFCDASLGDVCYIESITFCKTAADVQNVISY